MPRRDIPRTCFRAGLIILGGLIVAGIVVSSRDRATNETGGVPDFSLVLRAWDRATEGTFPTTHESPAVLRFPRDHGAHGDWPFELWEAVMRLTANDTPLWLRFRMMRLAAFAERPRRPSAWAAHEFFRGELMLGDPGRASVARTQRHGRVALGIAGHDAEPPRIWIDRDRLDWSPDGTGGEALRLRLREREVTADLHLVVEQPHVSSSAVSGAGEGLWRGYLYPWLRVSGELLTAGGQHRVAGHAWLLHNWGALPPMGGQIAFDRWFMQFDEGPALALLQMRRRDGTGRPSQRGLWISADGQLEPLAPEDLRFRTVPRQGRIPAAWMLESTDGRIRTRIEAMAGQQLDHAPGQTWAGAIQVEGTRAGRPVMGWGFVELGAP